MNSASIYHELDREGVTETSNNSSFLNMNVEKGNFMATLTRTIRSKSLPKRSRGFAQVVPGLLVKPTVQEQQSQGGESKFDKFLLSHLENAAASSNHTALILEQYGTNRGKELNMELRQSTGKTERLEVDSTICPIYLVAHVASNGARNKICISSGFKLQTQGSHDPMVLTCAHTLEVRSYAFQEMDISPKIRRCAFPRYWNRPLPYRIHSLSPITGHALQRQA